MNEDIKSGAKTSEFWVSLAPLILSFSKISEENTENSKYMMVCGCVLGCFYIASRTAIKINVGRTKNKEEIQGGY
jgi:hypothetical protein